MDFPRKRALVACNFCRHRKRKCDGQKPTCAFCANAGARCEYQETTSEKPEPESPAEIVERLNRLEDLVRQQTSVISNMSDRLLSTTLNHDLHWSSPSHTRGHNFSHTSTAHDTSLDDIPSSVDPRLRDHDDDGPSLIPLGHQTPTGNLLMLDRIKSFVGIYPAEFFLSQEAARAVPPLIPRKSFSSLLERLVLRRDDWVVFVAMFFDNVHSQFPVIERTALMHIFNTFLKTSQANLMSDALCLTMCALGQISSTTINVFDPESEQGSNGTEYFAHANKILNAGGTALFSQDPITPLAYFFASVYMRYRGRPLEAWRHIHTASTGVQMIFSHWQDRPIPPDQRMLLTRIAWGCYILECDDLAEFHFPPSGIELLIDRLPFPEFTDPDSRSNAFLAICSIRKILNRIHSTMYSKVIRSNIDTASTDHTRQRHSIASLESVNVELHRQLDAWFASLPAYIKPELRVHSSEDLLSSQLQTRFYAAKHIISRPCLIYAAQLRDGPLSDYVMSNCKTCVESCQNFIRETIPLLGRRTASTWLRFQALLAAVLVLSIAQSTPSLTFLVQDFDTILTGVIACTEPWARHHDSAESILSIFKTMRHKLRLS